MNAMESLVRYGYLVIFGAVFAEQVGLPFPSEPFLLAGGGLAGSGRLSLVLAVALAAVASLIGDTFWYWLGRTRGPRVMSWLWPLAGVVQTPGRYFLVFSALAGAVWGGAYLVLGWIFSAQLEMVAELLDELGSWTFAFGAAAIGGYVGWKYISRRRFLRKINVARITPEELKTRLDRGEDLIVVDVRDRSDFQAEPAIIPGALHMTVDELERRHREIPRERDIVLYCTCAREQSSAGAALLLRARGIERIRPLAGGYHGWRDRGYPMTSLATTTSAAPATTLAMATQGGSHA